VNAISSWLKSYWAWTSRGPKWHWAAGIGGPLLALLIVVTALAGEDEPATDRAVQTPSTQTTSGVTGSTATATTQAQPGSAGAPGDAPTVAATQEPAAYVVQPGDSLSAICAAEAPTLPVDDCIQQVVQLNGLADASQVLLPEPLARQVVSVHSEYRLDLGIEPVVGAPDRAGPPPVLVYPPGPSAAVMRTAAQITVLGRSIAKSRRLSRIDCKRGRMPFVLLGA